MEACLIDRVNTSLKLYMYRNATFLCERLYAESSTETNLHLLATCYFRSNQAYRAYHLLKGIKSPQCRYLFAMACFEMGNMAEAEAALLPPGDPTAEVPNGAAGYYMLGLISRLTDRRQAAVGHYTQALSLDPFFWSAYEDLCLLGVEEDPASFFGDLAPLRLQQQELKSEYSVSASQEECSDLNSATQVLRSSYLNNGSPKQSKMAASVGTATSGPAGSPFLGSYNTPSPGISQIPATIPPTPVRNAQGLSNNSGGAMAASAHTSVAGDIVARTASAHPQRRKFLDEGKLRKVSGRLFAEPAPRRSLRLSTDAALAPMLCSTSGLACTGVVPTVPASTARVSAASTIRASSSRKGLPGFECSLEDSRRLGESSESTGSDDAISSSQLLSPEELRRSSSSAGFHSRASKIAEGAIEVLALLRTLGEGFRHLCMYRSQEALQAFAKLPQDQYETGWVLCQVGRAYFEMVDYTEAERAFSLARRVSPYRLEGSDIYSTVLYHMKKDVELSYLAQEIVSMDRLSPQAWCVIGNCFSLQKDHETALKFFQRALQLDSHFTYAHTLCGHEYVAMEDFEEGLACYRNAIRMDARHYNAWYGLGTIYFRQEKYELAEYHFRRALRINGRSSVLHCYLGMALHALKKNQEALDLLGQAIRSDPKNPLPKYQKANVLMSEESYDDALGVLEQLKEVAPRESSVYFLIGKVYKRLGQPERAMYHFCVALDLKPSTADVNLIKTAIEKLHVPDELEEENL